MLSITQEQTDVIKKQMKAAIDVMTSDDYEGCLAILSYQKNVLEELYYIDSLIADSGLSDVFDLTDLPQAHTQTSDETRETSDAATDTAEAVTPMYRVERKLKGAGVPAIDGYIPEIILREQDIEHGDYVYATSLGAFNGDQQYFNYTLAVKMHEAPPAGRRVYTGCPVMRDGHMLYVDYSSATDETIRLHEAPYRVLIKDKDIRQLNIAEGDVIDVAFYENNPGGARAFWNHPTEAGHTFHIEKSACSSQHGKTPRHKAYDEPEALHLDGYTVCIVGDKSEEPAFRDLIEKYGGYLSHVEPSWGVDRIDRYVRGADVAIGLYEVSSHKGIEQLKTTCNACDIPFRMIPGKGKTKTIQTAIEMVSELEAVC